MNACVVQLCSVSFIYDILQDPGIGSSTAHNGQIFPLQLMQSRQFLTYMHTPDIDSSSLRLSSEVILDCVKLAFKPNCLPGLVFCLHHPVSCLIRHIH